MKSLIPKFKILNAGAAPLVAAFCREIKLRDIIDEMVASAIKVHQIETRVVHADTTSISVADSALVTNDNLDLLFEKKIPFISRLPETFSISAELKDWAWSEDRWQHLGSLVQKKDAAVYRIQQAVRELNGHAYRFIVVHSSSLDKKKEKSIKKMIETRKSELLAACDELAKMMKSYLPLMCCGSTKTRLQWSCRFAF